MNLSIGKTYSFNTASPVFLGATITQAKLKSIVDADTARKFAPIDQTWAQIFPGLPAGTANDVENMTFYIFSALNGDLLVMAEAWIIEDSIVTVGFVTHTVTFPRAALADATKIRIALTAAGLSDFVIKTT